MKRIIGLTGGIATGKTTVANYLADRYNLPILDADVFAREAVSVGSPILQAIAQRYGENLIEADGNLNRQRLGEIIFNDEKERHWVEGLIHPFVLNKFIQGISNYSTPVVLVIPLLFETGMTNLMTEIWVVTCEESEQLQRLMSRNNLTKEQALARVNSQMSLAEKVKRANIVLDNSSTLEELFKQVDIAFISVR